MLLVGMKYPTQIFDSYFSSLYTTQNLHHFEIHPNFSILSLHIPMLTIYEKLSTLDLRKDQDLILFRLPYQEVSVLHYFALCFLSSINLDTGEKYLRYLRTLSVTPWIQSDLYNLSNWCSLIFFY